MPAGFVPCPVDEPGHRSWGWGDVAAEVRWHFGTSPAVTLTLRNEGDRAATVAGFRLSVDAAATAWLSGAVGRWWLDEGGCWAMSGGWCAHDDGAALVFGPTVTLAPGQAFISRWRYFDEGAVPPLPSWVPAERYLPQDEPVLVADLDVAVSGGRLGFETTDAGSLVRGPLGVHELVIHTVTGTTVVEVGWYAPLRGLLPAALAAVSDRDDVEAWLLARVLGDPQLRTRPAPLGGEWLTYSNRVAPEAAHGAWEARLLDRLDVLLGRCFERPTFFGALAGLYAAQVTDLLIVDEARAAAMAVLASAPGSTEAACLAAAAMLLGELEVASALWLPTPGPTAELGDLLRCDDKASARRVASRLGYGLPNSAPEYTARDVALAQLWLATRPDSIVHVELGPMIATAKRRLLCRLATTADPLAVAWLLVGSTVAPGASE